MFRKSQYDVSPAIMLHHADLIVLSLSLTHKFGESVEQGL